MDYFGDSETLPDGCGRCDNCQMHNRLHPKLGSWELPVAKKSRRRRPPDFVSSPDSSSEHDGLREALRSWRLRKSREMGIPPYTLFWNRTLDELCQKRPAQSEELLSIWGIGEQKCRVFGAEILAVIKQASLSTSL